MRSLNQSDFVFAVALAGLAGYVDALGFLATNGFFVSFMSGNSTRLGVGVGHTLWPMAGAAVGLIIAFVVGVACGSLAARGGGMRQRWAVLALVTLMLSIAFCLRTTGLGHLTPVLLAMAMGAENAVFQRDGGSGFGVTYMTGALVKVGQGLARILSGEPGGEWLRFLALWAGLVGGAVLGSALSTGLGVAAFALAPIAASALCVWAWTADRRTS